MTKITFLCHGSFFFFFSAITQALNLPNDSLLSGGNPQSIAHSNLHQRVLRHCAPMTQRQFWSKLPALTSTTRQAHAQFHGEGQSAHGGWKPKLLNYVTRNASSLLIAEMLIKTFES